MNQLSCADLNNLVVLATERGMEAGANGDNDAAILYLDIVAKLHDSIAETYASDKLATNHRSLATHARALVERYQSKLTSTKP